MKVMKEEIPAVMTDINDQPLPPIFAVELINHYGVCTV